jgi:iron-sulfur cluster repair protein YtfE (RIC family)
MDSISSYMEHDHDLIDAIGEQALAAAAAGDDEALEREATRFLMRLRRHIEMEENVLFPAFEEQTGMSGAGPSAQMRIEHEQMHDILQQMQEAAASRDGAAYRRAATALREILVPHNLKEEQMMYPMIDDAAGDDGQRLLEEVKAMAMP